MIYWKISSMFSYLRGALFLLLNKRRIYKLKIGVNFRKSGQLVIGENSTIGENVNIYKNVVIGNNTHIGDFVEIRVGGDAQVNIGNNTSINRGSTIYGRVAIGSYCSIAPMCNIIGSNHIFESVDKYIKEQGMVRKGILIGDDVWIGAGCNVLDGVTIGNGSVIGAGSVVTHNIPPYSVAVGNPCRVINHRL